MMLRNNSLRLRLAKGDEGIAIIMVIAISLVLMLLVTVALGVSLSGMTKSKTDEKVNGAIAAAYAGIEDYKSKIAGDNNYYRYGNPSSLFSTGDPALPSTKSKVTLPVGALANPAFGVAPADSWATVNGTGSSATYRYEVDNSKYQTTGVLRIRSTGRVGTETRTVVADLRQKGFIDFLYYTTYEIQDPEISGKDPVSCIKYAWAGRPVGASGGPCSDISFGSSDQVHGPVHSNDTIRICGAIFDGVVTTNSPTTSASGTPRAFLAKDSNYSDCSVNPTTQFLKGAPVSIATPMDLPPTNGAMKNEARTDLADDVAVPGCLYTGPTKITFNAAGTMTIRSPWTRATQVAGEPVSSGTTPTMCGLPGTGTNQLASPSGATIPVLPRNLIFVQNVKVQPTTTTDHNVWAKDTYPSGYNKTACTAGNFLGYPVATESVSSIATSYGCTNGDIFVEGTVNAEMTLAAENYVYVTGDITYAPANAEAVLGLVAQNAVWVWNPVKCVSSSCSSYASLLPDDRRIDAAIASVKHTFQVQNYNRGGSQGKLTVNGAIAQLFRGIVRGTVSGVVNGYAKDYWYDERFRFLAPPKFLSPVQTIYGVSILVEVKTAYTAAGSAIP